MAGDFFSTVPFLHVVSLLLLQYHGKKSTRSPMGVMRMRNKNWAEIPSRCLNKNVSIAVFKELLYA